MTFLMELNVTFIIFDGYVEVEKYRALYFVVFCSAFVVIICSNSTIVCLIWIHKNLHEPMYFFIAALLLNAIIFSTALYPKILVDVLSKKQIVTYSTCLFQWYIFYAVAAAEFWLLMAMAYDRYLAICKPLQYPTIMTRSRVNVLLAVAWTVPALIMGIVVSLAARRRICSFVSRGIVCNSMIYKLRCVHSASLKKWVAFSYINVIFLPMSFTCFTYVQIFIVANRRGVEVRRKAVATCFPHLIVLFNYFFLGSFDVLLAQFEGEFSKVGRFIMNLQFILCHPLFNPFIYGLNMKKIFTHLRGMLCAG